jgi:hypothetical protein
MKRVVVKTLLEQFEQGHGDYTRGVLAKYASHVTTASQGAVTDADLKIH